jgi:sugar lactone lactonase YvrE
MKQGNRLSRIGWCCGVGTALALLNGCGPGSTSPSDAVGGGSYADQQKREERARSSDPAWRPRSEEIAVIQVGEKGKAGNLHNFCLHTNGNILACWGQAAAGIKGGGGEIRVFTPEGRPAGNWALPVIPQAICVDPDGTVFVGGSGQLFKLDAAGKELLRAESPAGSKPVNLDKKELETMFDRKLTEQDVAQYQKSLELRKREITGMAVCGEDVFVACPSTTDFSFSVYRLTRDLTEPKLVVKGLRGCCGQMDIQAKNEKLWIPHNAKHRVEAYDRDGKKLVSFGKTDRTAADGFGGCCEPKNLRIANDGKIYAAESGPPVSIKRFTPEGKFDGVAALPKFTSDCVRVTVEVSADCKRFYILSTGEDAIHVLAAKD